MNADNLQPAVRWALKEQEQPLLSVYKAELKQQKNTETTS